MTLFGFVLKAMIIKKDNKKGMADEVLEDSRCYTLVTGGVRHVKLWVMKKVEHPLDIEEKYKNKGKTHFVEM